MSHEPDDVLLRRTQHLDGRITAITEAMFRPGTVVIPGVLVRKAAEVKAENERLTAENKRLRAWLALINNDHPFGADTLKAYAASALRGEEPLLGLPHVEQGLYSVPHDVALAERSRRGVEQLSREAIDIERKVVLETATAADEERLAGLLAILSKSFWGDPAPD